MFKLDRVIKHLGVGNSEGIKRREGEGKNDKIVGALSFLFFFHSNKWTVKD